MDIYFFKKSSSMNAMIDV